jgi:hypothetical protein
MDALYCVFCLEVRKNDLQRAVTIMNGQACCFDHLYYVQGGEYSRILKIIKLDELTGTSEVIYREKSQEDRIEETRTKISGLSRFLRGS